MDALSSPHRCRRCLAASAAAPLAAAAIVLFTSKEAAAFEAPRVMTGHPLDRVVAGANRLFALSGAEVRTFDSDGEALGRCAGFASPPQKERRAALGALDAEETLRAAGLPDDDSTPEAEEALEDEGLGPKRRTRPQPESDAGILPHALAASEASDAVWIATSSGVFRGDENGCLPAGLDGRDLLLVAAGGGALVAASDNLLFMRPAEIDQADPLDNDRKESVSSDGDGTFTVIAGLAERPRALALGADGAAIVADDDGVLVILVIGGDGTTRRIVDRPTDALAVCGGVAIALADDGVYRWTPGTLPVRTSDRPPVRGIACGPTGEARWIATGLGVWTSPDAATWTERTETLGRRVAWAATVGDRTWLALDSGLVVFNPTTKEHAPARRSPGRASVPAEAGVAAIPTHHLVPPALPWPEVTALFGLARTPDRRSWQVMMLLTFPLGRVAGRHADPTAVAAESVRRDQALAREQVDLASEADTNVV
jgi:hypothetical protein